LKVEAVEVQTTPFRKVSASTAEEICSRAKLSTEAMALLTPALSPQGFLALLVKGRHFTDAVRFLAFSLPPREGVWWACVAARGIERLAEPDAACLERVVAWAYEPNEAKRRACMEAAERLNFEGAAAYAALSVFWSGGSMAPEGMPDAPPDPSLYAIGVGASVLLAIAAGEPQFAERRFEEAIERGIDIANGGNGKLKAELHREAS
jgi:hypothetical protein